MSFEINNSKIGNHATPLSGELIVRSFEDDGKDNRCGECCCQCWNQPDYCEECCRKHEAEPDVNPEEEPKPEKEDREREFEKYESRPKGNLLFVAANDTRDNQVISDGRGESEREIIWQGGSYLYPDDCHMRCLPHPEHPEYDVCMMRWVCGDEETEPRPVPIPDPIDPDMNPPTDLLERGQDAKPIEE